MKNTMLISIFFSFLLLYSCSDERNESETEENSRMNEVMSKVKGTPPDEIKPHPLADDIDSNTSEANVTDREIEQYVKINRRLETINTKEGKDLSTEMNRIVKEEGLTLTRYQEIGIALQNDSTLQDKMTRYQNENKK